MLLHKQGTEQKFAVSEAFSVVTDGEPDTDAFRGYESNFLITNEAGQAYVLAGDKFVRATSGYVPAFKCYLWATEPFAQARALTLSLDDETTDLTATPAATTTTGNGGWYNLQGQRIEKPVCGIYIRNGKKIVIK